MGSIVVVAGAGACAKSGDREVVLGASPTTPGGTAQVTAPVVESPTGDVQLATLRPTFIVRNATSTPAGTRTYEFQVSDNTNFTTNSPASFSGTFAVVVSQTGVAEGGGGTTSFTPSADLQPTTRLYWRARATQGSSQSEWSSSATFRTKLVGFIRAGELYDPLVSGETVGTRVGSTTFITDKGIRVDNNTSWVRYDLPATITSGEFSVEVEGLRPNTNAEKSRIFSMMDNTPILFNSKFLMNVQYRGIPGNPDNCISFKILMGDSDLKYEPDIARRTASVRSLDPSRTYLWKATWGTFFNVTVLDGGIGGTSIYDYGQGTSGTYNPSPQVAYLGATDAAFESGSYAGAIYRNVWIANRPRPTSLGSALRKP